MQVNISGHQLEVTEPLRTYIGEKLERLERHFDKITNVQVTMTVEKLKQISNNLSKRLSYLLEPINPIEVDSEQCLVQMRSSPPAKGEDGTSYYELLVRRGGELRLSRYAKTPGQPRRIVPAQVTREVFLRLVADFSAAV